MRCAAATWSHGRASLHGYLLTIGPSCRAGIDRPTIQGGVPRQDLRVCRGTPLANNFIFFCYTRA